MDPGKGVIKAGTSSGRSQIHLGRSDASVRIQDQLGSRERPLDTFSLSGSTVASRLIWSLRAHLPILPGQLDEGFSNGRLGMHDRRSYAVTNWWSIHKEGTG